MGDEEVLGDGTRRTRVTWSIHDESCVGWVSSKNCAPLAAPDHLFWPFMDEPDLAPYERVSYLLPPPLTERSSALGAPAPSSFTARETNTYVSSRW